MKTNERWSHLNFITECSALRAQAMCSGFSGHKFAGEAARPLSPATQAATAAARDGAAVDARAPPSPPPPPMLKKQLGRRCGRGCLRADQPQSARREFDRPPRRWAAQGRPSSALLSLPPISVCRCMARLNPERARNLNVI